MIAITKCPTTDKMDKNIIALIIVQYYKILKKLSQKRLPLQQDSKIVLSASSRLTDKMMD